MEHADPPIPPAVPDPRPVILVGMHRSGTTMLSKALSECSVFMGATLSRNHESTYFQAIDREILDFFGCSWAWIGDLPSNDELSTHFLPFWESMGRRLLAGLPESHFGVPPAADRPLPSPWGWKDPRTCLLLPFYRRIFPEARVLFLHRSAADAAMSLVLREEKHRGGGFRFPLEPARERFRRHLGLWEAYNRRARDEVPRFARWASISYERLAAAPQEGLLRILEFLGIPAPVGLPGIAAAIRKDRTGTFPGPEGERYRGIVTPSLELEAWRFHRP